MATITTRKLKTKTCYDVQFYLPNGGKKKVYAFPNKREAMRFGDNVDRLVAVRKAAGSDADLRPWILKLEEEAPARYDKLVEWGLLPPRKKCKTLQELAQVFLEEPQLKPQTQKNRKSCVNRLLRHFKPTCTPDTITRSAAAEYYHMLQAALAVGTWGREIKTVKQFFNLAVEMELIQENPFMQKTIKGSSKGNASRFHFVTLSDTEKILQACRNSEERLIFSLARFGGLRIPSELKFMEWSDIDFEKRQFIVRIPKKTSKRQQAMGQFATRIVPMFPELQTAFTEYWEDLPTGAPARVFPNCPTGQALRSRFLKVLRWADIQPWEKFFQNMRSTRETELTAQFPIQDVSKWLGNTPQVALHNYLQPTEDVFRAAIHVSTRQKSVGTNIGTQCLADVCSPLHENQENLVKCERLQENERVCKRLQTLVIPSREIYEALLTSYF